MQDAYRTADAVIVDLVHAQGQSREAIDQMLSESGVLSSCVTNAQWKRLEAFEAEAGQSAGKPREKVTDIEQMLDIVKSCIVPQRN
ncbi:hypothetical protein FBU31_003802 [Coemansia sp. 'formosensis']|nr:hypothetical protein FBU31_003802 [Coemansia sp. 'formosensis']